MAGNTPTTPGVARAVIANHRPQTNPPATITLPVGDRLQIAQAIEALIDLLDEHDHRPQFEITDAGRQALAQVRS